MLSYGGGEMEYYSVLENGAHSLVRAREKLNQYYENHEDERNVILLKEATMFLSHGIEILFKEILFKINPKKVIKKDLVPVYHKKMKKINNPAEADIIKVISSLRTISLSEANKKIKDINRLNMNNTFNVQVATLVKCRNQLFHFTMNPLTFYEELWETLISAESFFETNIKGFRVIIQDISVEYTSSSVLVERARLMLVKADQLNLLEQKENYMDAFADMLDALEHNHR